MARKKENAVSDACKVVGSQRALADKLKVSEQVVSMWAKNGWVPVRRAPQIESLTGIPRGRLINPGLLDLVSETAAL